MLYKGVFAVGDSFTRGDELADCTADVSDFSQTTWPALIAKSLNIDYDAVAIGGRGNQWISFVSSTDIKQDNVLIVNWTWFERFDYIKKYYSLVETK